MINTYKTKKGWKFWLYDDKTRQYMSDGKTYKTEAEANLAKRKAMHDIGW